MCPDRGEERGTVLQFPREGESVAVGLPPERPRSPGRRCAPPGAVAPPPDGARVGLVGRLIRVLGLCRGVARGVVAIPLVMRYYYY